MTGTDAGLPSERLWTAAKDRTEPFRDPEGDALVVHLPEQVDAVARRPDLFSSAVGGRRDLALDFLLTVDPPRHGQDRALAVSALAAGLQDLRRDGPALAAAAAAAVDWDDPLLDLVRDYARPLAAAAAARVLGLAPADVPAMRRVVDLLVVPGEDDPTEGLRWLVRASPVFSDLHAGLLRRNRGTADGTGAGFAAAVAVAAVDTLAAMLALNLTGPPRPDASPETPLLGLYRRATATVRIGGTRVLAGEQVLLAWSAAQRHAADRGEHGAYLFGRGPHACPAARPARSLVTAGVEQARLGLRRRVPEGLLVLRPGPRHVQVPDALLARAAA